MGLPMFDPNFLHKYRYREIPLPLLRAFRVGRWNRPSLFLCVCFVALRWGPGVVWSVGEWRDSYCAGHLSYLARMQAGEVECNVLFFRNTFYLSNSGISRVLK